jgi:predicted TIM-barrel fold metal-dependent hydrolase
MVPPRQCPCKPPCLCNWTLADYVATSAPALDVSTVIFCEVDAAHSQWLAEAKWVQSIADSASTDLPRIGAIIAQPPPGFLSVPVGGLTAALDSMKLVPLITAVRPSFASVGSAAVVKDSLDELGRRGLVVDLNMPLVDMASVVQGSPATRFVIEHMAKANVTTVDPGVVAAWTAKIKALAQFTNIECFQLGGVMHAFHGGAVDTIAVSRFVSAAVAAFGWGRVCFEVSAAPHMQYYVLRGCAWVQVNLFHSPLRWGFHREMQAHLCACLAVQGELVLQRRTTTDVWPVGQSAGCNPPTDRCYRREPSSGVPRQHITCVHSQSHTDQLMSTWAGVSAPSLASNCVACTIEVHVALSFLDRLN